MQFLKATSFNFIRWRWHAMALSGVVILSGFGLMASRGGLPLGVDFSGGTIVVLKFEEPVAEDVVRNAIPGDQEVVQRYGQPDDNEILIRLPQIEGVEEGTSLEEGANQVMATLQAADVPPFETLSTEIVGPIIGRELQLKGIYATLASMLGILLYIAFRFRATFAVGAVIAVFHDVLVTIAFLSFMGYELSLNVVAAILTIVGYSVNDTIVVFDRVRENLRTMRKDALEQVINTAVNQTLNRTLITSGTTFLTVMMLFLLGGEVLKGFAFTMVIGVITGTYSTVFIAASVAIMLSTRRVPARAPAASPTSPVSPASEATPGRTKSKPRKARAS